jgi:16S rRNA (cytidine1402-2'-O)-methyltransferase
VALCRELTKLHEEILRTTLSQAVELYAQREPKGEYVLVVEGAPPAPAETASPEDALERVTELRGQGFSLKTAVKQAAQELSIPKNLLYDLALGKE